ncbi:MAG: double-strand break repair helicase AddA [Rhizobiales bacterium]|nr:double-strand break repair helicase AddA [Hyphomicrobiales bacterium]
MNKGTSLNSVTEPIVKTITQQSIATNPRNTVWVSANAGSGKTYVLSRRVIRLLLLGTKPSQLLCLTFTKAAAAEMSNRVFKILGEWAVMPEDKLYAAISDMIGEKPNALQLRRARQLFAMSLDTPGGLKIQTIHAFCDALLHQFPLEANVPAHFEQIDTPEQTALLTEANREIILASLGMGKLSKGGLGKKNAQKISMAFETLREHTSEGSIEKAIKQLIDKRDEFSKWAGADISATMDTLWEDFDLNREDSEEAFCVEALASSIISRDAWIEGAHYAPDKMVPKIESMLAAKDAVQKFAYLKSLLLKADETPPKNFANKKFRTAAGLTEEIITQEQELLIVTIDRIKSLKVLRASEALFTIANAILIEYANLKQRRNMLDFSDLIRKAADLLNRKDITAWIQYKLDRGIDHVLVDEAQDTSPLQWEIINALTLEFYAGDGARDNNRTMFVVGDEKQSIYSFQGADPNEFDKQKRSLQKRTEQINITTKDVQLSLSFRSTEEVLNAVDTVFSLPENRSGLVQEGELKAHTANRSTEQGEVSVWELIEKPTKQSKRDWLDSIDAPQEEDAEIVLSKKIAYQIKSWLDNNEKLPGRSMPIKAGDILILVRKRDKFATSITRDLKRLNIPSAGADRLNLTGHIVVEDMMALGRFSVMQMDDLALASILKSPLFDFSEEQLFEITHYRGDEHLYEFMAQFEHTDLVLREKVRNACLLLESILTNAKSLAAYDFYAQLFSKNDLRRKYLTRMGNEAEEVIDGFLQAAISHDANKAGSLTDFIEWLAHANPEIKREIDLETNEVRVITTHSSKGLEAPIVFLVDPGSAAFHATHMPAVAKITSKTNRVQFLWQSKKEFHITAANEFREQVTQDAEEEYRRLLYVGMTRAADKLIVCGYGKANAKYPHWHSMVLHGLQEGNSGKANGRLEEDVLEDGYKIYNWHIDNPLRKEVALKAIQQNDSVSVEKPEWLFKTVPTEILPPKPLTPSGVLKLLDIGDETNLTGDVGTSQALEKGNAVHRLLQVLPDVEASKRIALIEAFFLGQNLDLKLQAEIKDNVLKILDSDRLKSLFDRDSRAEVSICGQVTLGSTTHMVRGQIDRLVVNDDKIIIADYKTNYKIPDDINFVSKTYIAQLALYRELIANIYPNREVICLFVWTQNASVMRVPNDVLDQQLTELT